MFHGYSTPNTSSSPLSQNFNCTFYTCSSTFGYISYSEDHISKLFLYYYKHVTFISHPQALLLKRVPTSMRDSTRTLKSEPQHWPCLWESIWSITWCTTWLYTKPTGNVQHKPNMGSAGLCHESKSIDRLKTRFIWVKRNSHKNHNCFKWFWCIQ